MPDRAVTETDNKPEALSNDFFTNLLDMGTQWNVASNDVDVFEGRDRKTGEVKWTGTRVDLLFGSNSELRALARIEPHHAVSESRSNARCMDKP